MVAELSRSDRMRLMRFVCSFAWADLEVQNEERAFVTRLMNKLDIHDRVELARFAIREGIVDL